MGDFAVPTYKRGLDPETFWRFKVIIKLQLPLMSTHDEPLALIYNKDRSVEEMLPVTDDVRKLMKGRYKAFFHAEIVNDKIVIDKEAKWQSW